MQVEPNSLVNFVCQGLIRLAGLVGACQACKAFVVDGFLSQVIDGFEGLWLKQSGQSFG